MNTQDRGTYNMIANQEVYSIFLVLAPSRLCVFILQFNEKGERDAKGVIVIVTSFVCVNTSHKTMESQKVMQGRCHNNNA